MNPARYTKEEIQEWHIRNAEPVDVSALAQKLVDKGVITLADKEAIFKAPEVVKEL